MPEYNPESYMDVEAFELYGPNYKELKLQYEGIPASDADLTPSPAQQIEQPVSVPQEAPEEPVEESGDVSLSEIYRDITATVGAEEADATHAFINSNATEEELSEYLGLLKSGSQEAVAIFQAAKEAKDAGYEDTIDEYYPLSEDSSAQLIDRFGGSGQDIVTLNQQLMSGQITDIQMRAQVLRNPSLLRTALEARSMGLIAF